MARLDSESTVLEIVARLDKLRIDHPTLCTRHEFSGTSHKGRKLYYLKITGGGGSNRLPVLLVGGIHAREIAPPAALVNFSEDLLEAYKKSTYIRVRQFVDTRSMLSITYPKYVIPKDDVKQIIKRLDLYIAPLANPDGRAYALSPAGQKFWRKNRAPSPPGTPPCLGALEQLKAKNFLPADAVSLPVDFDHRLFPISSVGVDLNRNFNIAWEFNKYFNPAGAAAAGVSDYICSLFQDYYGPSSASEPETQFIQWLVDTKKIRFFLDVHSYGPMVLYPWGMEFNQSTDDEMNFRNTPDNWDRGGPKGGRDGDTGNVYSEYFPNQPPEMLLKKHQDLAKFMAEKILNKAGAGNVSTSTYSTKQSVELYPTTGVADDYAFSHQFVTGGTTPPVYALTLESGSIVDQGFHPTDVYRKVEREIYAALWAFLCFAAKWRAPAAPSWCFVATATFGSAQHRHVRFLQDIRDNTMKSTPLGCRFMAAVDRVYLSFSPKAAWYLEKCPLLRRLIRTCVVLPIVWQIRGCVLVTRRIHDRNSKVAALIALFSGLCLAQVGVAFGATLLLLRALGLLG